MPPAGASPDGVAHPLRMSPDPSMNVPPPQMRDYVGGGPPGSAGMAGDMAWRFPGPGGMHDCLWS